VSFDIARYDFDDPDALMDHDRIEGGERRWQTIGMVGDVLLLLVAHTVRFENKGFEDDESTPEETEIIRIISARRADRKERQRYEKERQKSRDW
jgi:uncharacterized DUF497 family protein